MIDISPFNTHRSCGSSSSESLRIILPTLVSRISSGMRFPSASNCSRMVLNLMSRKGTPLKPGRSCTNQTLPLFTITRRSQVTRKKGDVTTRSTMAIILSSRGLRSVRYKSALFLKITLLGIIMNRCLPPRRCFPTGVHIPLTILSK